MKTSIFDQERKRLGLPTSGASSFFEEERRRLFSGEKLRYSEIQDRNVDNARFAGRAQIDDSQYYKPKETKNNKKTSKPEEKGLLSDIKATGKAALQFFNPFDDVSAEEAVNNYLNRDQSKAFQEVARGSNRAADSASLGIMSNLDKKVNNRDPYYNSERKFGEGGGTDMITSGLGYLIPGIGAYKGLNATKFGMGLTEFGTKGLTQRLLSEAAKGATIGAGLSSAEVGIREGLNPQDQNWKDNLKYIGKNTGIGAIGDPLMYGAGKAIGRGFESVASRSMKNLMPNSEAFANEMSKVYKVDNALPIKNNNSEATKLLNEFIQSRNVKAPTTSKDIVVPKIGSSELPPLNEFSVLDRNAVLRDNPRPTADFSTSKPVVKPGDPTDIISKHFGVEVPKDLVESAPPEYWQKRYDDFVHHIEKSGYNPNNLNYESINELWSHFAKPEEPSLENVIDLAYNGYKESKPINANEVWGQMGNRPSVSKKAKEIIGVNKIEQPKLVEKPVQEPLQETNTVLLNHSEVQRGVVERGKDQQVSNNVPTPSNFPSNEFKERGHIETLRESNNATESLKDRVKGIYKPVTNDEAVNFANQKVSEGLEKATSFVKSARVLKPEHIATAHRLIQEFQKNGQIEKAVDIAEHIAEQGTKAGQVVQAFSIFDRLSPEGILVHANRIAERVNAKLNPLQLKVRVTAETANQLTDFATTVQKMTEQKGAANEVINLMDKARSGEKLTESETKQIRQFVEDAKQWIGDITPKKTAPKAPKKIINQQVKEHVISFLDKQEEAARTRLAARKNRALSGLPVDDFYDYTVIGASKLAKGTMRFADFSEQMIREFGEEISPYVQQIYDKASEMVTNEVKRTVNRLSEVEKIANKALKNGKLEVNDAENLRKFALSISKMSGDEKIEASQELQATLQALERPSLLQQVSAAQTISQLLNPKTLVRNAIGNELFYRLERINKLVATPMDWTRVKVFGGNRTVTFRTNNQGQYWKNWIRGWNAGIKGVNPEGLSTQYDLRPNSFNGKWNPLTYLEKVLGASLKSFDYAGYKRAVNNTIGELATLRATNEGLKGQARKEAIQRYIREVDENVLAIADQYGKYVTFQDNNVFSVGLQKFKRGLNVGKEFGIGDLIIKYPKTPGSLLGRALEYSPAGFLKSVYAITKPFFNKQFVWNEVIESFTRALIGSGGITGIAWFLADKGIITGAGNKDFDVAELENMIGKKEYSLNVDSLTRWIGSGFHPKAAETKEGDQFVTYNWAQPVAMAISIGANVNQSVNKNGKPNISQSAYEAANGALDTLVGMSVLQGVQKAFTSYPGQTTGDKLTDIAGDLPASFVPTALNQVRQFTDNTTRNTYDPLKLPMFNNRAKNKIPGVAQSLPPSYDTLGRKKEVYQDQSNTIFNVFLNPAFVSQFKPSPEAKMVLDIINDTGDNTVAPRRAPKYLMIDGKRYDLTPAQYSKYQRRLGEEVSAELQSLLPHADTMVKEELGKQVNRVLDHVGRNVREQFKEEYR